VKSRIAPGGFCSGWKHIAAALAAAAVSGGKLPRGAHGCRAELGAALQVSALCFAHGREMVIGTKNGTLEATGR
jgi:hypothetical protein